MSTNASRHSSRSLSRNRGRIEDGHENNSRDTASSTPRRRSIKAMMLAGLLATPGIVQYTVPPVVGGGLAFRYGPAVVDRGRNYTRQIQRWWHQLAAGQTINQYESNQQQHEQQIVNPVSNIPKHLGITIKDFQQLSHGDKIRRLEELITKPDSGYRHLERYNDFVKEPHIKSLPREQKQRQYLKHLGFRV